MGIRTELSLRLANSPGALSTVCHLLSEQRINVVVMTLESSGQLRLLVDNHVGAAGVLRARHHQVTERDVLVTSVSHGPGALQPLLQRIAEAGVNVDYVYGGAAESSDVAIVVIAVDNPRRASAAAGV
jgi:hypothetical protein